MKCTMLLCRIVLLLIKIIAVQERLWNVIQDCNGWNQLPYIDIFVSQLLTLLCMKSMFMFKLFVIWFALQNMFIGCIHTHEQRTTSTIHMQSQETW